MRIDLFGQRFVFPDRCACCGQPPDTELAASASKSSGKRVVHTKTNAWDFPYCGRCVGQVKNAESARAVAWILGILSTILSLFLGYAVNATTRMVIGFLAISRDRRDLQESNGTSRCAVWRGLRLRRTCNGHLGWHGTLHQFDVCSPDFARDFLVANQSKLVNLSTQAKNLLAGAGVAVKTSGRTPRPYMS